MLTATLSTSSNQLVRETFKSYASQKDIKFPVASDHFAKNISHLVKAGHCELQLAILYLFETC